MSLHDELAAIRDRHRLPLSGESIAQVSDLEAGWQRTGKGPTTSDELRKALGTFKRSVPDEQLVNLMRVLTLHREGIDGPAAVDAGVGSPDEGRSDRQAPGIDYRRRTPRPTQVNGVPNVAGIPHVPAPPIPHHDPPAEGSPAQHPTATPRRSASVPVAPARGVRDHPIDSSHLHVVAGSVSAPAALPEPADFTADTNPFDSPDDYLGIKRVDDRLDISWDPMPSQSNVVLYLVVGAPSAVPNSADEGERLAVTTLPRASVPSGHRYYAIFAYRGKTYRSATRDRTACRQAVGQVVPAPRTVDLRVNPDSVVLRWDLPGDVAGAKLRRSHPDGEMNSYDTGLNIPLEPGQTSYNDREVLPGRAYIYQLVFWAKEPRKDGGSQNSLPWTSESTRIPATPESVDDLAGSITEEDGRIVCRLTWTATKRGSIKIFARPDEATGAADLAPHQVLTGQEIGTLTLGYEVEAMPTVQGRCAVLEDFEVDVQESAEWTFTPVSEMSGQFIIGRSVVATHVGAIHSPELFDRVDWQFVRFEWPTGAKEVIVEHDGVQESTSHRSYRLYGGCRVNLMPQPAKIRMWGRRSYRGRPVNGPSVVISYRGRSVVLYQVQAAGRFQRRRALALRPITPLPDFTIRLVGGKDTYPLILNPGVHSGTDLLVSKSVPRGSLPFGVLTPVVQFEPVKGLTQSRAFVHSGNEIPIVAIEVDPIQVQTRAQVRRCPKCLAGPDPKYQYFRCTSDRCPPTEDEGLARSRGVARILAKPVSACAFNPGSPTVRVFCQHCGMSTQEEVCGTCHESFPDADWWQTDSFAVTLLGPRWSGKTTMLQAESFLLEEGIAETWGGTYRPLSEHTRQLIKRYHDEWSSGSLQQPTVRLEANRGLLSPMEIGLSFTDHPRPVSISLFDVAGEDLSEGKTTAGYGHSLVHGDALFYLVDPLQIDQVRLALDGFVLLPPEGDVSPVQALQNVISVIRGKVPRPGKLQIRLAVIFSKFDAILQAATVANSPIAGLVPYGCALSRDPYANPARQGELYDPSDGVQVHHEARTLLQLLGAQALLNLVESNFENCQYFVSSTTGHTPSSNQMHEHARSPHRLFDPLRWLVQG